MHSNKWPFKTLYIQLGKVRHFDSLKNIITGSNEVCRIKDSEASNDQIDKAPVDKAPVKFHTEGMNKKDRSDVYWDE